MERGFSSLLAVEKHYYSQEVLQAILAQCGPYREVAVESNGVFRRNLVLRALSDFDSINLTQPSAFFASVEQFQQPERLSGEEASSLRTDWDYAIDIDSLDGDFREVKDVASLFFRDVILPMFELKTYRMKFSGRKGIHIVIPGDSFFLAISPTEYAAAYPIVPLQITKFFSTMLPPESLAKLKLDLALYNPRRLLRCAYSLHTETDLVAVPIWPDELERFNPERDAKPETVTVDEEWLNPKATAGEASLLLQKVAEWLKREREEKPLKPRRFTRRIKPGQVMPCLQAFMEQGFKTEGCRNLVLFNAIQAIKRFSLPISPEALVEINARGPCPLPERELKAMIRYHFEKRADSSYFFNCETMRQANLCPPEACQLRREVPSV